MGEEGMDVIELIKNNICNKNNCIVREIMKVIKIIGANTMLETYDKKLKKVVIVTNPKFTIEDQIELILKNCGGENWYRDIIMIKNNIIIMKKSCVYESSSYCETCDVVIEPEDKRNDAVILVTRRGYDGLWSIQLFYWYKEKQKWICIVFIIREGELD